MVRANWTTVQVAANTSTGNQTITGPLGGLTPKAVTIEIFPGVTAGTIVNHCRGAFGMTDGTNSLCQSHRAEDAQTTTDTGRRAFDGGVVDLINTINNNQSAQATFVSFNANNVIINWNPAPTAAVLMNVTFFYGSELQALVQEHNSSSTEDEENFITSVGFEPHCGIVHTVNKNYTTTSSALNQAIHYHGMWALNAGSIEQVAVSYGSRDALTIDSGVGGIMRDDSILQAVAVDGVGAVTFTHRIEVTTIGSDSLGVTTRAASTSMNAMYLLLNVGKNLRSAVAVDLDTATTGTGTNKTVTTGWRVQAGRFVGSTITVA